MQEAINHGGTHREELDTASRGGQGKQFMLLQNLDQGLAETT
jgi:hypothetical protein